jgi:hypothetical protein
VGLGVEGGGARHGVRRPWIEGVVVRVTKVLLMSALAMAFAAGPAAAAATVIHTTFHGTSAEAVWRQGGPSFFTETFVNITKMPNGQQLSVGQITENYDSEGAFTGAVGTSTRVTTGFSYTIDASQLSSASASGSDLPAATCTYDTNYDLIGCVDSTIDVNVSWTGQGELIRGNSHHHDRTGGVVVTAHLQGVFRDANASGVVGGITLTSGDLFFADISRVVSGQTVICIGC